MQTILQFILCKSCDIQELLQLIRKIHFWGKICLLTKVIFLNIDPYVVVPIKHRTHRSTDNIYRGMKLLQRLITTTEA